VSLFCRGVCGEAESRISWRASLHKKQNKSRGQSSAADQKLIRQQAKYDFLGHPLFPLCCPVVYSAIARYESCRFVNTFSTFPRGSLGVARRAPLGGEGETAPWNPQQTSLAAISLHNTALLFSADYSVAVSHQPVGNDLGTTWYLGLAGSYLRFLVIALRARSRAVTSLPCSSPPHFTTNHSHLLDASALQHHRLSHCCAISSWAGPVRRLAPITGRCISVRLLRAPIPRTTVSTRRGRDDRRWRSAALVETLITSRRRLSDSVLSRYTVAADSGPRDGGPAGEFLDLRRLRHKCQTPGVISFAVSIDGFGAVPTRILRNPIGPAASHSWTWFFPTTRTCSTSRS